MSATVESSNEALEQEICKWNGFAIALRRNDRESFDRLIERARSFAVETGSAGQPIVFETMTLSIILSQDREIRRLEEIVNTIKPPAPPETVLPKEEKPVEPTVAQRKPNKQPQRSLGDFG